MDDNQEERRLARATGGTINICNIRELFVRQLTNVSPCCDQDTFFDCLSSTEECSQDEGHDSEAMRCALERTAANIQRMLSSLNDRPPPIRPIGFTLEITTTLAVNDDQQSGTCGRITGHPVTVHMPLQFDPRTRQLTSDCQGKKQKSHPCPSHQHRQQIEATMCECRSISQATLGSGKSATIKLLKSDSCRTGKVVTERYMTCESESCRTWKTNSERSYPRAPCPTPNSSCVDFPSQIMAQCHCTHTHTCWFEQNSREVISITAIPCSLPCSRPCATIVPKPAPEPPQEEPQPIPVPVPPLPEEFEPESEPKSESSSEEAIAILRSPSLVSVQTLLPPPTPPPPPPPVKRYYLARPQHREFANCSPCRFDPSPIIDDEGNVFCPGHCGCCQCAWKPRSLESNVDHQQVKVCRCINRGTIFTTFDKREVCSTTSSFDLCPCREKAEAKFLELYHCEMWEHPELIRGREVQLSEIQELRTPYPIAK